MARTALFSAGLGALIAWSWGRLEAPHPSLAALAGMTALGIVPALVPRRARVPAAVGALVIAGSLALEVYRPWAIGTALHRLASGFLDFYDVLVPFDGSVHPLMHGVVLLAVFTFSLLAALAVAARRSLAAILALVAACGWPSTIYPGGHDLLRGAVLFAAALALLAWLEPRTRRVPPQILVGAALIVFALAASSSGAVAKGQFLDWQTWDLYTKAGKPLSVEYIWHSDYNGIRFPRRRTRVFTVHASPDSAYWRATTLDAFRNDGWDEDRFPVSQAGLTTDPLLPAAAADRRNWTRADFTIDALRDVHLVSTSQPVAYDTQSLQNVQYWRGGIAITQSPVSRGDTYTAWGYEPQPKPAQLAKSPPDYPPEIRLDGRYLRLEHSNAVPPFGTPQHETWARAYFNVNRDGRRYRPLYLVAKRIAGKARNPYAAAIALEAWFRSAGGFTYDEQPPRSHGIPPLVLFVTKTKRGYCQHFAGAMALMLRYLGIPSRVAAGFTSGTYDSTRKMWDVYDRDAHTWVEVWFRGYGWLPFDPTPGRGTLGGPYTASSLSFDARGAENVLRASALAARSLLRFELGSLGKPGRGDPGSPRGKPRGGSAPARTRPGSRFRVGTIVLFALFGLAALLVAAKLVVRRARYLTRDPRRIARACRQELAEFLGDQRVDLPRSLAPHEFGTFLGERVGIEGHAFGESLGLARFGPLASASAAARQTRRELRRVRARIRRVLPLGSRVRGAFSLRSLFTT